jgi:hypothetical protein
MLLFILFFSYCISASQQNKPLAASASDDSSRNPSNIEVRRPPENILEKFRSDRDFKYDEIKSDKNILEHISTWINDQLNKVFQSEGFYYVREYLGYLIAIFAILIVLYILKKTKLHGFIYSTNELKNNFKEFKEDINSLDFEAIISEALRNKQFKTAIRYYYLKSLKNLSDKNLIEWKVYKTNYQYFKEIKEPALQKSFGELIYLFEYAWYGDIPVIEELFIESERNFSRFNLLVNEIK